MMGKDAYIALREKIGDMDSPKYDEIRALPLKPEGDRYVAADISEVTPEEVLFPSKRFDIGVFYLKEGKIVGVDIATLRDKCENN
jgi:hypothetical protein